MVMKSFPDIVCLLSEKILLHLDPTAKYIHCFFLINWLLILFSWVSAQIHKAEVGS